MRQTLLFGGLESIVRNVNRKAQNLRFFEVGNVYKFNKEKWSEESPVKAYSQDYHMALWVTGKRVQGSWAHPDEESTFYELRHTLRIFFVVSVLHRACLLVKSPITTYLIRRLH